MMSLIVLTPTVTGILTFTCSFWQPQSTYAYFSVSVYYTSKVPMKKAGLYMSFVKGKLETTRGHKLTEHRPAHPRRHFNRPLEIVSTNKLHRTTMLLVTYAGGHGEWKLTHTLKGKLTHQNYITRVRDQSKANKRLSQLIRYVCSWALLMYERLANTRANACCFTFDSLQGGNGHYLQL